MSSLAVLTSRKMEARRATVLTPLGIVPIAGLEALRAFGREADRLEYPRIDIGGFIVPGRDPVTLCQPGMEEASYAPVAGEGERTAGREEVRFRSWERERAPSSPQAASGETPHAVRHGLTQANLDLPGLAEFHPLARVVANTGKAVYVNTPLGLFRQLGIGARLTLELPLIGRARLSQVPLSPIRVPDVRAWAVWEGGASHGQVIASHHQYPDQAICACMSHEWVLGLHALRDYVAFCALWAAKLLHERLLGRYPGLQHYSTSERVRRDRRTEYCGCGRSNRYAACCRRADLQMTAYERWHAGQEDRALYLVELKRQGRAPRPPAELLRMGILGIPVE